MPKNRLTPEEIRRLVREKRRAELEKIEKETRLKIFIIRYKEKILKYSKLGCLGLLGLAILITTTVVIVKVTKKPPPPPPPPPVETPPEDFQITVEETKLIPSILEENSYDVLARIRNADPDWGVSRLNYKFILKNKKGEVVGVKKRESYILPQQERYLVEVGINTEDKASSVEVELSLLEVQKLKQFINPGRQIRALDVQHSVVDRKSKVFGDLINESPHSFEKVDIVIVLYDVKDQIIAINYTNVNAFVSGTARYFSATWPEAISEKIKRIEIEVNVNVYETGSFMNIYGTGAILEY